VPQVRFTDAAIQDLGRLREFLRTRNPAAAQRAVAAIKEAIRKLGRQPQIGRPADDFPPEFRELVIEFGDSGYVAVYRYEKGAPVVVLAIRHQKEAGYGAD
jgi:plasmid stabilization system protein ParE